MQPYFSIGQLAQLFDVPVATLRYYDEIGLLKPARVDPQTHYRYYASEQFERLSTIKYLRALGVPLAQIKDFVTVRQLPKLERLLRQQRETVQAQLATLRAIDQRLQNRLDQVQQAQHAPFDQVQLVTLPARPVVGLRERYTPQDDIELVIAKLRDKYGLAESVFLGKIALRLPRAAMLAGDFTAYTGVALIFEAGESQSPASTELAGGPYAQLTFRGTHAEAAPHYQRLLATCATNGWELRGAALEIALIDYGITEQVDQSVTQIQVPVQL